MQQFVIEGQKRISGEIKVQGAKNSVLPILAATILTEEKCVINNCPNLSDVNYAIEILTHLGCEVEKKGSLIEVDAKNVKRSDIPENLMREMRSSVMFLGPVLSRLRYADMTFPGGCELGPRPINLHVDAFRKLGANIKEEHGHLICDVGKIKSSTINLTFPSVGATENIMLLCAISEGITIVVNAAKEPEIEDLQCMLNKMGANISGAGSGMIKIVGVKKLKGCFHEVIPDRIAAITYLCCAAITGGEITLNNVNNSHIHGVISVLEQSGCDIKTKNNTIYLKSSGIIKPVKMIRTMPYPGFPTDAQAILMSYLTVAKGTSVFVETIFENRFRHVDELASMGADITVSGRTAVVSGVKRLTGAKVNAQDLRGGAALIVAGLRAEGISTISDIKYIERGYEKIEEVLSDLGASIKRI